MGLHDWACVHEGGGRWVGSNKVVELKKKKKFWMLGLWLFYLPSSLVRVFAVRSVGAALRFSQASYSQHEGSLPYVAGSGHLPSFLGLSQGSRVTPWVERSLNAQLSPILPPLCEKAPSWSTPPSIRFTGLSPHRADLGVKYQQPACLADLSHIVQCQLEW